MMIDTLAQIPPLNPLLGTTGTELLLFGLLIAAGVWFARRQGHDAGRFVLTAFVLVSIFYLLCPEQSEFQRRTADGLMQGMAIAQAGLMNLGGWSVEAEGASVVGSIRFTYVRGCMGLSYLAMGILVLLAQPLSWRNRLTAMVVVLLGMFSANLIRLMILYHLWSVGSFEAYDVFHRVGGGVFAVAISALYAGVLAIQSRTAPFGFPMQRPVRLEAAAGA